MQFGVDLCGSSMLDHAPWQVVKKKTKKKKSENSVGIKEETPALVGTTWSEQSNTKKNNKSNNSEKEENGSEETTIGNDHPMPKPDLNQHQDKKQQTSRNHPSPRPTYTHDSDYEDLSSTHSDYYDNTEQNVDDDLFDIPWYDNTEEMASMAYWRAKRHEQYALLYPDGINATKDGDHLDGHDRTEDEASEAYWANRDPITMNIRP